MSWRTDQYIPSQAIVASACMQAIVPVLTRFESEVHDAMATLVSVWHYDRDTGLRFPMSAAGVLDRVDAVAIRGEARLRFRRTVNPQRSLFRLQAIYRGIRPETGFSGFRLTGAVKESGEVIDVQTNGYSVAYNQWEWDGPT